MGITLGHPKVTRVRNGQQGSKSDNGIWLGPRTVTKALKLLAILARAPEPMGLAQLAREANMDRTAVYRLLNALSVDKFVEREPGGRHFTVGRGLISLSATVTGRLEIRSLCRPVMVRLAEITGETVSFVLTVGVDRVVVDVIESRYEVRRVVHVGMVTPLYLGSGGKAIMAYLDQSSLDEVLGLAATTGIDVAHIRGQLAEIRANGYVAAVGEYVQGVGGFSVPVFGPLGVLGALTVSGPATRWSMPAMRKNMAALRDACSALPQPPSLHIRESSAEEPGSATDGGRLSRRGKSPADHGHRRVP